MGGLRRRKYSDIPDDDVLFQPARSSVSSSSSRGIFGDPLSSTSEVGNCERLPFLISGVTDGIDSFADEGVVGGGRVESINGQTSTNPRGDELLTLNRKIR